MKIGSTSITDIKVGSTQITKVIRNGITYWEVDWTPQSLAVEDASPTLVVMTGTIANTSAVASDFTIAGFTVNSLSRDGTNKILTLTLNTSVVYGDTLTIVFKGTSYAVTNNVGITLPQKLIVTPDPYVDEMDSITGWTQAQGTRALNTTEFHSGTGSIKLTSASGANAAMNKVVSWNLPNGNSVRIRAYSHNVPVDTIGNCSIYASKDANMTDYFVMVCTQTPFVQNTWKLIEARAKNATSPLWVVGAGAPNWNNINFIQIKQFPISGQITSISWDLLTAGVVTKPAIMISFDDGYDTIYNVAYPLMKARGMVGTAYIISDQIGAGGFMTAAQLQELNANGWDIGNHTKDHTRLSTLTQQQVEDELEACKIVLDGLGFTRSSKHVAYPYGDSTQYVLAAMAAWGAKTGRGGGLYTDSAVYEFGYPYNINWRDPGTLAETEGFLDTAIIQNAVCVSVFHKLVAGVPTGTDWNIQDFTDYLDYAILNNMQSITIDEYDRLYSGDITVNHK